MRIRSINIARWRHFENIELKLDADSPLVCIVGANGTGKSHLLELVAACAHRLGLSQGIDIPRGDPFSDAHEFSLTLYLADGVSNAIEELRAVEQSFAQWDRTITLKSKNDPGNHVISVQAGGIIDNDSSARLANRIVEALRQSKSVHFLSLDADRAYPKKNINPGEMAQAYQIDWAALDYTRGRSFKPSSTLYEEWLKYFLAIENQSGTRLMQELRRAKNNAVEPSPFIDPFEVYAKSLKRVLPHLFFTGVDSQKRTLTFDTTGLALSFDQLSGGEREIAFLIGQIDRFGLREGLFLIDEPELHLNGDLIRTWVAYLMSTVSVGQIWLATHSLEAVEAAGQQATFILERNETTRKVDALARLDKRPILSALSRAVGTPAFSIAKLRFVFVEGEEGVGERERFGKLTGLPQTFRFIECGSCTEVLRRISAIKSLAAEAESEIHVGGVIDRDFRTSIEIDAIQSKYGAFVLGVHEVENFFLHPLTVSILLQQNGISGHEPADIIRDAADARAGSWIFQYAMSTRNAKALPEIHASAKDRAKAIRWDQWATNRDNALQQIVTLSGYGETDQQLFREILNVGANAYDSKRGGDDFWKVIEGKQALSEVARTCGFGGPVAFIQASFALWGRDSTRVPQELTALRDSLRAL